MPTIPEALSLAFQHHQAGRLPEAEALYRQILQAQPQHPDALNLLGVIAHQGGHDDVAIELISKAIALNPSAAEYHNNLGIVLKEQGKLEKAIGCYRQALALQPAFAEAYNNLGNALKAQGKLAEAVACYRQAVALKPTYAEAHQNLGLTLQEQDKLEEAVACYRQALALKPESAETVYCLGTILQFQGKLEEAVTCYRQALALKPESAETVYCLGTALQFQGKLEEAVACYRQALALKPDYPEAENQLMHHLQHLCDWGRHDEFVEHHREFIRNSPSSVIVPFTMLSVPSSPAEQLSCARNHAAHRLAPVARLRDGLGFQFARVDKPKLRIGYLSADFHQHATAYLIAELFELHDRTQVEVIAYSYGPDDGGAMRTRIAGACDRFVDVASASYGQAAQRIYEDGIDILIDLKGYTGAARTEILALRPAPIQVNWLGYPGTMGAEYIDYIITDRFLTPPGQEPFFSEKLVCLPDCYQINDRKRAIAEQTPTREECELPGTGVVFCSFNNTYKITPAVFDIWMRVLRQIPGSVLWLLEANTSVAANLRREAKSRGVEPERLVFAPKQPLAQHLARHRNADLFLDTYPYNSHTTASDALWAGLPVLTCAGETFASRVAGSLLTAIGLPELITHSLPEYEAAALRLARDPSKLAALRKRLADNRLTTPLFDSERFIWHLEQAYRMMWDIYAKGKVPRRIEVPALRFTPKGR